jgi:uncharacterized membrane protein
MPTLARPTVPHKHPMSQRLHEERTRGERLADTISDQIGSWRFLVVQTVVITLWVAVNAAGLILHWDPYPFVLLSLLFSVQAAYVGPILLLSQNRSAQRDRIMAEHDYVTNERSEQLTEALLSELLRNSQATLAIAGFHGIELDALVEHESQLAAKVDAVQEQLAEVEDVLLAAAEAAGEAGQGLFGGAAADSGPDEDAGPDDASGRDEDAAPDRQSLGGFGVEDGFPAADERGLRDQVADLVLAQVGSVRVSLVPGGLVQIWPGRACRGQVRLVGVAEQVLLDEPARTQVGQLEVGELRAEPLAQVRLGSLGELAHLAQETAGLAGHLGQFLGAEHDQGEHGQDQQLREGQVEHRDLHLRRSGPAAPGRRGRTG